MLRVFIEFLCVRSKRQDDRLRLVPYEALPDDITIESFGVSKLKPEDFGEHSQLIAIVHEGIKKGTVDLTWQSGHEYKSDEHFLQAVAVVLQKLYTHLYCPLGYDLHLHADLEKRYRQWTGRLAQCFVERLPTARPRFLLIKAPPLRFALAPRSRRLILFSLDHGCHSYLDHFIGDNTNSVACSRHT